MRDLLLVGSGSFLGGIARYCLSGFVSQQLSPDFRFPAGTFGVNFLGCLLIGLVGGLGISDQTKLFIITGFLGGFTTFSAFSNETFYLMRSELWQLAALYVLLSVLVCLIAVWAGYKISQMLL